jgi:hypothetical protein
MKIAQDLNAEPLLKLPDRRLIKRKYELTEKEKQEKKLLNEVKRRAHAKK